MKTYRGLFALLSLTCLAVIPLGCTQVVSVNDTEINQSQEQPKAELPSPEQELPRCKGKACIDLDPVYYGCHKYGDRNIQIVQQFQDVEIQLWYSIKCQASWAYSNAPISSVIYTEDAQGQKYGQYTITRDKYYGHYGNMGPGKKLKACFQMPNQEPKCTKLNPVITKSENST